MSHVIESQEGGLEQGGLNDLANQYGAVEPLCLRLLTCLSEQLCELLQSNNITIGNPLETRLKNLSSIREKLERKALNLKVISELDDLVGLRIILLYRDDLKSVGDIIRDHFDLLSYEDTSTRLGDSQFGYQSDHFVVRIKPEWEMIPTYRGLRELKAEIQVRTMAQHIWATASHKLQYKNEENVPHPLRRTINRVSALLETVDLELNRVQGERAKYTSTIKKSSKSFDINVDVVAEVLSDLWPSSNISPENEEYDSLTGELRHFGIVDSEKLRELIQQYREEIVYQDKALARQIVEDESIVGSYKERASRGAYFTQVAMTRIALRKRFGDEVVNKIINCGGG